MVTHSRLGLEYEATVVLTTVEVELVSEVEAQLGGTVAVNGVAVVAWAVVAFMMSVL